MGKKKDNIEIQQNINHIATQKDQPEKPEKRKAINKVAVIVAILAVVLGALCLLFSKERKPSDTLVFTVGTEKVYLDEVNFCILQNKRFLRNNSQLRNGSTGKVLSTN